MKHPFKAALCVILALEAVLLLAACGEKDGKSDASSPSPAGYENLPENPVDFKALRQDNADICGWISVENTDINYPVLQSAKDKIEDFYLDHGIDGGELKEGCIYIQRLNKADFSDPNTLVYGHNMKSGTMFGQLKNYRQKDYFESHRKIRVCVPGHILDYEIVSAFVYDDRHILRSFNFKSPAGYADFISACLNPTSAVKQVAENAQIKTSDRIITLSTCTSNEKERYLVVAKLITDTRTR